MTSNIVLMNEDDHTHDNVKVEYIEHEGLIKEGMFALIVEDIQLRGEKYPYLDKGDLLLIEKLKFANNTLHTIILRDHPKNCIYNDPHFFSYLYDEFCSKFRIISAEDGNKIRKSEIAKITAEAENLSKHIEDVKNDPNRFMSIAMDIYSKRLKDPNTPKTFHNGNITQLLGQPNALERIEQIQNGANMATDIMDIKKQYIETHVAKIKKTADIIKSFFAEKCEGYIASTSEVMETAQKINDGVESLNLFTLKNVQILTIKTGMDAPTYVPLTLLQERIIADVELAFYSEQDANRLDINNVNVFFDALRDNPSFVNQIFSSQRCVVVCAIRETDINYKDTLYNLTTNTSNKQSFLMLRNGENIHVVYSPIDSHLAANQLFPAKKYMDELYQNTNSELDITIDSLNYSDVLNEIDRITLHFKRFLLLLAGLQLNKGLLGQFHPIEETFNIFNLEFQEKYMNFIFDRSGEGLIGLKRPSLADWMLDNNSKLKEGSTILVKALNMISYESAPTCYKSNYKGVIKRIKSPSKPYMELKVEKDEHGYFVRMPFKPDGAMEKESKSKVWIDELNRDEKWQTQYLVMDYINPEDLMFYIGDRASRKDYLSYIRLFKNCIPLIDLKYNSQEYQERFKQIQNLKPNESAVVTHNMALDALHFFENNDIRVEVYLTHRIDQDALHEKLIAFSNSGDVVSIKLNNQAHWVVYTTMPLDMKLEMLEPHYWLTRTVYKDTTRGLIQLGKAQYATIKKYAKDERELYSSAAENHQIYFQAPRYFQTHRTPKSESESAYYLSSNAIFKDYEDKKQMLDMMTFSKKVLEDIYANRVDRNTALYLYKVQNEHHGFRFENSNIAFPVAMGGSYNTIERIMIYESKDWLQSLVDSYNNTNLEIVEQDNSHLKFGFASYANDFRFEPESLIQRETFFRSSYQSKSSRLLSWMLKEINEKYFSLFDIDISNPHIYDCNFGNKIFEGLTTKLPIYKILKVFKSIESNENGKSIQTLNEIYAGEINALNKLQLEIEEQFRQERARLDPRIYKFNYHLSLMNNYEQTDDVNDLKNLALHGTRYPILKFIPTKHLNVVKAIIKGEND